MPKFLIEREIPGAEKLTQEQLYGIFQKWCSVLKNIGPHEALVHEHAKQGGFPASQISEVKRIIDPTTAETEPTPDPTPGSFGNASRAL